ncbi:MAG: hypothetical protein RR572_06875, partial [Raoultibacter sp.]
MTEKKDIPQIRFKNFTAPWEQRKFEKTFLFLQNNTLSRADLNYQNGEIRNVHYGDVLIRYGECLDLASENLPFITDDSVGDRFRNSMLQEGDVIIADAAEDESVGKCTELRNSRKK